MTEIRCISLDTSKKVYVTNVFEDAICDACDSCDAMYFFLFMVTSIHSFLKVTKIRNSETLNKMQGDAEDSTVQDSKNRETELIIRKVSRKSKVIQKKKLSDTQCESYVNTVTEELASSENITN